MMAVFPSPLTMPFSKKPRILTSSTFPSRAAIIRPVSPSPLTDLAYSAAWLRISSTWPAWMASNHSSTEDTTAGMFYYPDSVKVHSILNSLPAPQMRPACAVCAAGPACITRGPRTLRLLQWCSRGRLR
eukprot:XP_001709213.1 Hypothetical protein GL50803_31220 [Giardia lamblia ATCC 50803]